MITPLEIVPILIAAIVLWVGWGSRLRRENRLAYRLLIAAFLLLVAGWLATVLEEVGLEAFFDTMEHGVRMLAALLVALACWRLTRGGNGVDR